LVTQQVHESFADWVAATYPDHVMRVYDGGSPTEFRLSEVPSIQLRGTAQPEYAAAQG